MVYVRDRDFHDNVVVIVSFLGLIIAPMPGFNVAQHLLFVQRQAQLDLMALQADGLNTIQYSLPSMSPIRPQASPVHVLLQPSPPFTEWPAYAPISLNISLMQPTPQIGTTNLYSTNMRSDNGSPATK